MKTIPVRFALAKIFYRHHHRTNKPPVGHKRSYVALLGEDWNFLAYVEENPDAPDDWLSPPDLSVEEIGGFPYPDIVSAYNDADDHCFYIRGQIVGICTIGRPVARWEDPGVYEFTRICFDFEPKTNKERKYYSKFIREAMSDFQLDHQVSKFVTYIHDYQSGKYLEYAGFKKDKHINYSANDKGWATRDSRSHSDLSSKYRFIKEVA
tara:strand:+ start:1500 stop:2123 length:624 start_codon:yes stop_codon:yes gene_type:complete